MTPARWLVVAMIVAVAGVGALAWWDEGRRSEAGLDELGAAQLASARLAARVVTSGADPAVLRALGRPGVRVVLVPAHGAPIALDAGGPAMFDLPAPPYGGADGRAQAPTVEQELAGSGERVVALSRDEAAVAGLPARRAMAGIVPLSNGDAIAVIATGESQRDRDREGVQHWLIALAVAGGLVAAFGGFALARQRAQLGLAHELAVADAARSRDAELERLSRAATMAALGSGVAHELATPLGVIVGRAEQLLARGDADPRVAKSAQAILDQANDIDRIVRGLLGLARGAPIAMREVAARELVGQATALVEHRFARAGVQLASDVPADAPDVRCEPLLFRHALVNLLLNACDAAPAGSAVHIAVEASAADVAFAVIDEGDGITAEAAARATEPFFTTKPAGRGTGLGLAIANEIARAHRGTFAIAARTPRGTRAVIALPRDTAASADDAASRGAA